MKEAIGRGWTWGSGRLVLQQRGGRRVRFPKHHGSGILTLHINPNPGSSKGCFLENQ